MLLLAVCLGGARVAHGLEPPPSAPTTQEAGAPASPEPSAIEAQLSQEVSALRDDLGAIWLQIDRLTDGEKPPRWATEEHARLDRRLERVTTMLERLSARIETPIPRLNEPVTLLTVSLCTLILGFLAGRALGRRATGRDSRFRL